MSIESARQSFSLLLCAAGLTSCSLPDVNLATAKPLEVNLNMRLDVYQYTGDKPKETEQSKTLAEAVDRQRNRLQEIQTIKNNRFVGEDHRGLLQLRDVPAGEWGDYVKRTVEAENEDRMAMMRNEAANSNRALHEVQSEQWKLRADKAFKGEYIEVPGDKEGIFKWVQATGPKEKAQPAEKASEKKAAGDAASAASSSS